MNLRIQELRKVKGLTQEQLAVMVGVSTRTIQGYEANKGKINPPISKLNKIAEALEVDISELIGNKNINRANELVEFYLNGILSWSENIHFSPLETTVIREHLSELLAEYKLTIESLANANYNWKYSQENYFNTYRSKGMTDEAIQELFLKQELEKQLHQLSIKVNNIPGYFIYNQRPTTMR